MPVPGGRTCQKEETASAKAGAWLACLRTEWKSVWLEGSREREEKQDIWGHRGNGVLTSRGPYRDHGMLALTLRGA